MAEYLGISLTIGGTLPANLIPTFLKVLKVELNDINGPTSEEELRDNNGDPIKYYATSNYGECENIKDFCEENNLGYIHTCKASDEAEQLCQYWIPGMKNEVVLVSNHNGEPTINAEQIRPLINLLLEFAKDGDKCLPLHINDDNEDTQDIIEKSLKNPKEFIPMMTKKMDEFLPIIPKLPPFSIK
jgi:hypothetical protein